MKRIQLLTATLAIGFASFLAGCDEDGAAELARPTIAIESSAGTGMEINAISEMTIAIEAPGLLVSADVTLTGDGTMSDETLTGVGEASGSLVFNYTAPAVQGDEIFTVTVLDEQGKTSEVTITVTVAAGIVTITESTVSGTWEAGNTYVINADVNVPEGSTLTVEAGVTVIFEAATDASYTPQLTVLGDLYSIGTADAPVVFTVPESQRIEANIFAGLWGGIQAAPTSDNVVLVHTAIEYAGGASPETDVYDEGEFRYGFYFENPEGNVILDNARISYTTDDGMRIGGANLVIVNSTFEANGHEGGEAINIKDGTVGVVAYNLFFGPATNGIKWEGFGADVPQSNISAYNNTIVNGGYRRTKSNRGGSINVQEGAKGMDFNNLIVNCKYGTRAVTDPEDGDADIDNFDYGFHLYYGQIQSMVDEFIVTSSNLTEAQDSDVIGAIGENDPLFVSYDVTTVAGADDEATIENVKVDYVIGASDFHLTSGSPALSAGTINFAPVLSTLTAGDYTVIVSGPSSFIGAFGG